MIKLYLSEYTCFWRVNDLNNIDKKFILVEEGAAPDFLVKVLKAKMLLKRGEARNSTEACKLADVSRSAYYKYKDSVYFYEQNSDSKIVTVYLSLQDKPGVLSSVISSLYEDNANIITVNQNIPAEGIATVTISLRFNSKKLSIDDVINNIIKIDGVISAKLI